MNCKKCGSELKDDSQFCNNCGYKVRNISFIKITIFILVVLCLIFISIFIFSTVDNNIFKSRVYCDYINPNLGGIGVGLSNNNENNVVVIRVVPNLPADNAGIKVNDVILKVNNINVKNDSDKARDLMRGKPGTKVKLLIERNNEKKIYKLKRENILERPGYYTLANNVYLRQDYLKYKNGIYYFWIEEFPGAYGRVMNKKKGYVSLLYAIDILNQKIALVEGYAYNDKNEIIDKMESKQGNIEFNTIIPNSVGYSLYEFIKNLDEDIPNRYKKKLTGYFN